MTSIKKKYTPPKLQEYKQANHKLENINVDLSQEEEQSATRKILSVSK
jgi:hypothetical protein